MSELSKWVYRTSEDGVEFLYNSVTQDRLPVDAAAGDLQRLSFYGGQEDEALRRRLMRPPASLNLTLLTTWECNMRCSHCCVLHFLKKEDPDFIDPVKLEEFLTRYFTRYPDVKVFNPLFIGGEAFLYPERVSSMAEVCHRAAKRFDLRIGLSTTTNLSYKLTVEHIRCLEQFETITVSLDGFEDDHNRQRRYFGEGDNPFKATVTNLKRLVRLGLADRLFVQAALPEKVYSVQYAFDFTKFLLSLGIPLKRTLVGTLFPTKHKPAVPDLWATSKRNNTTLRHRPCCKYRFMGNMQINPDGKIFDNYYTQENALLGTISDSMESLEERNLQLIFEHMPSLSDPTCRSCPALGFCWGGCISGHVAIGNRPSWLCSRELLVPHIQQLAASGELNLPKPRDPEYAHN
jgi:radical SAM protein with 4Fe4S-binding SPASM domain